MAKMQGECSRKQTTRRRHAEVCRGVFRITSLGEGRTWELREKLGWDAATATFRERPRGLAGPAHALPISHRCTQGRGVALEGGLPLAESWRGWGPDQ